MENIHKCWNCGYEEPVVENDWDELLENVGEDCFDWDDVRWWVECPVCFLSGSCGYTDDDAIEEWNSGNLVQD